MKGYYLMGQPYRAVTAGPNVLWRVWLNIGDVICAATESSNGWHMCTWELAGTVGCVGTVAAVVDWEEPVDDWNQQNCTWIWIARNYVSCLLRLAQLIGKSINWSINSTKMIIVTDLLIIDHSISVSYFTIFTHSIQVSQLLTILNLKFE